jgi:cytochrome d ubiquinol oxidase subunit I
VQHATGEQIRRAAESTVPNVPVLFWSFRIMVALGFLFLALFAAPSIFPPNDSSIVIPLPARRDVCLPLPWLAAELGWIVAEYGRQPWAIEGVLPTFLGVSGTSTGDVWFSLAALSCSIRRWRLSTSS